MNKPIFDPAALQRCISCGFCLPACPTYQLSGDEAASPRGRITLMRALQTGALDASDATVREQASLCLGCRACEPVCPAGVQYGQLLEQWRDHQWRGRARPLLARLLTLAARQRWAMVLAGLVRGAGRGARRARGAAGARRARGGAGARRARGGDGAPVGGDLMLGCFERALFPRVSRAALRLRPDLSAPATQGCCGALHAHNGALAEGERLARVLGDRLPGTIVTTSGGCAAHLASVLGRDRVRELSEVLDPAALRPVLVEGRRARVTLQDSCHLRNGLGVWREPRDILRAVADYVEIPNAAGCCGAAGTYAMLRRRESRRVLEPKLDAIEAANVDYVVAVNPGCLRQLRQGLHRRRSRVRAIHLAELLAGDH